MPRIAAVVPRLSPGPVLESSAETRTGPEQTAGASDQEYRRQDPRGCLEQEYDDHPQAGPLYELAGIVRLGFEIHDGFDVEFPHLE